MIGHIDELTIFDDNIKNAYTITLPLIFYFNKHLVTSIPLNASINTKYEITVCLRNLEEVTYKEEFSSFVDPSLFNETCEMKSYIPKMSNVHLMAEYIYLSIEERKIFASNYLEYLIDEIQFENNLNISDNNLLPVYKIQTQKAKSQSNYLDKNELDSVTYHSDLILRNDFIYSGYVDRTGILKNTMLYQPIRGVDPYIHKKRILVKNNFNHPSKLFMVLIKPNQHIDPSIRTDEKKYFFGERQWDNYGLYSYYDLSKIYRAKKTHFNVIKKRINDLEDKTFGFIYIINEILLDYTSDPNNKSLLTHPHFLESMQKIKDAYISYHGQIIYGTNYVKIKENLLSLKINFRIENLSIFIQLLSDIFSSLKNFRSPNHMTPSSKVHWKNFQILISKT